MKLHPVAVAGETDIGGMPVHTRRCQHMRLIDRHPLRFVEGRGITMTDMGIVLQLERHIAPIIGADGHMSGRHLLNGAKRPVLDPHAALVAKEHHPVAAGKVALAPLGLHVHIAAKFAVIAQLVARGDIEVAHLGIDMAVLSSTTETNWKIEAAI